MTAVVRQRVEGPSGPDATALDPAEDFSCTCLLLLLDERPASAAEMCSRLRCLGLIEDDCDAARVQVLLRVLGDAGLVRGVEATAGTTVAPTYCLTTDGAERLGIAQDDLRSTQILLDRFLARVGERLLR